MQCKDMTNLLDQNSKQTGTVQKGTITQMYNVVLVDRYKKNNHDYIHDSRVVSENNNETILRHLQVR